MIKFLVRWVLLVTHLFSQSVVVLYYLVGGRSKQTEVPTTWQISAWTEVSARGKTIFFQLYGETWPGLSFKPLHGTNL